MRIDAVYVSRQAVIANMPLKIIVADAEEGVGLYHNDGMLPDRQPVLRAVIIRAVGLNGVPQTTHENRGNEVRETGKENDNRQQHKEEDLPAPEENERNQGHAERYLRPARECKPGGAPARKDGNEEKPVSQFSPAHRKKRQRKEGVITEKRAEFVGLSADDAYARLVVTAEHVVCAALVNIILLQPQKPYERSCNADDNHKPHEGLAVPNTVDHDVVDNHGQQPFFHKENGVEHGLLAAVQFAAEQRDQPEQAEYGQGNVD